MTETELPISAWSGSDAQAMADERTERWRLRYEEACRERDELKTKLDAARLALDAVREVAGKRAKGEL